MAMLSVAAAVAAVAALRDTTPALVVMAMALYLLGLDALEPLVPGGGPPGPGRRCPARVAAGSSSVTSPRRPSGSCPSRLLGAAVVAVARAGRVGRCARRSPSPSRGSAPAARPSASCVTPRTRWHRRWRPRPPSRRSSPDSPRRSGWSGRSPSARSATVPVLALRELPTAGTAARSVAGLAVVLIALVWWVRRRDEWRTKVRDFMDAGRRAT